MKNYRMRCLVITDLKIQKFLFICSQYLHELPLVLVFGIATAVTTIHKVLPHAVSGVLSIERFQSQPSHICVLEIISKVAHLVSSLYINPNLSVENTEAVSILMEM